MDLRLLLASILLLDGTEAMEGMPDDFVEPNEDDFNREYVDMIMLTPFDPSPKWEECHRLKSVKVLPAGITEDLLCDHIIRFFHYQMMRLSLAGEKIRNAYIKLHEWFLEHGPLHIMRVTERNRVTATWHEIEKEQLAKLVDIISGHVDRDAVLKAHRERCKSFYYTLGEGK